MFASFEEAQMYIKENNIRMIDFKMTDIDGRWRHLTIPSERLTQDTMKYGIGFDGSNYGYAPVEKSDMVFLPDLASAVLEPFTDTPTLSMIGNVCTITENGNLPFDQYPRNVARAAEQYLKDSGIADTILLGPEFELHLFDSMSYITSPSECSYSIDCGMAEWHSNDHPNHGYQIAHKGGYHITPPQDFSFDFRNRVSLMLAERDVPVKYHHPEVGGPGQIEFELQFGSLTQQADRSMMLKYIVKNQAMQEGRTATFMPKPIYDEAGNGMHVHMMLRKDGQPVFYDEKGYSSLSQTALYFIGGLLKHAASLCALTNPSTNSYKRLVPGYEAPVTIGFATANRSSVIRIPAYAKSPLEKRFELRSIDATCNPYYAYAAILLAGLDGVKNQIDPVKEGWGPYDFNLFDLDEEAKSHIHGLPTSLTGALDALGADHDYLLAGNVFTPRLLEIWRQRKYAEAKQVEYYPHPAEFKLYYDL